MRAFMFWCLFLVCLSAPVRAQTLDDCIKPPHKILKQENVAYCQLLLSDRRLSARQTAQLLAYLGVAKMKLMFTTSDGDRHFRLATADWKQAITEDPRYVEPYLLLIDALARHGQNADALQTAEQGLAANPGDGRLMAEKALMLADKPDAAGAVQLCEAARLAQDIDSTALQKCGGAMFQINLDHKAVEYLVQAADLRNKADDGRIGIWQLANPNVVIAEYLSVKMGQHADAVAVLQRNLSKEPGLAFNPMFLATLGNYQYKAEQFGAAAESFGLAAKAALTPEQMLDMSLLQLANLARAGSAVQAKKLWNEIAGQLSKRQVLRLQTILKNNGEHNFIINGEADIEMERAMLACMRDATCFQGLPGQYL